MANEFDRNIKDNSLIVTKALPAAAANNNSPTLDLGGSASYFQAQHVEVEIVVPATPALVDAKTIIISLQDSADDSSYAATDPAISTTLTGAGGVGAAAKTVRFRLPSNVRRYIQFNQAVLTAGGDSTAVSVTYRLLF